MTDIKDRIRGVVFGTAIGDALGWPVEFDSSVTPRNLKVFPESVPEKFTDDTQMFRAVCEGMLRWSAGDQLVDSLGEGKEVIDAAAEEVAEEFIAWAKSPENNRAPGNACMSGCANLEKGKPWREAGVKSGGCGTAMRSMAYGLFCAHSPDRAATWAAEHAVMTHNDPMAQAAAAAVAAGVSALMDNNGLDEQAHMKLTLRTILAAAYHWDTNTGDMLQRATALVEADPFDVLNKWRGWAGHEAVAASLWCFLQHPDDYEKAVLLAVNSPGDSDSLGAITGALVGAHVGLSGIPERWVKQVEDREGLEVLADRIIKRLGL